MKSSLPILWTSIAKNTSLYQNNYLKFSSILQNYQNTLSDIVAKGFRRKKEKLSVRERLNLLIDPGSPFLELSPLAAHATYKGIDLPSAAILTGVGRVQGRKVIIIANDPSTKAGTYFPLTIKKHLRAQQIAKINKLPTIYLVDSGGVYLPLQAEIFPDRNNFGRIFHSQALMSKDGIPQISVVLGSCTAGGAYIPAMSDESVIVKGKGTIFLAGPPLVKAATGEVIEPNLLGGAELHCSKSGVTDHMALSEEEGILKCRQIIKTLSLVDEVFKKKEMVEEPLYKIEDLYGILDIKRSFDIKEVIARLVDGSRFMEFKQMYGESLVCGFGMIGGIMVGIVGNNGVLKSESALKGSHFVILCDKRRIPLIFLQNITGFMVGRQAEEGGIAKDGAKMVMAVSCATVPKITIVIGGSFGAGNYAMCGRAFDPHFMFVWPGSKLSVMGGEQASMVMGELKKGSDRGRNSRKLGVKDEKEKEGIIQQYEREGDPLFGSARMWDDGILMPKDTRKTIILALEVCETSLDKNGDGKFGVFRM